MELIGKQMNDIVLQTRDLAIGYLSQKDNNECLHKEINVALMAGEFACLLGPNGAGKSTLIKTLSGFILPISGQIQIAGEPLGLLSNKSLALNISVVLTEKVFLPNMSVWELVAMGRMPYTGFFGRLTNQDTLVVSEALEDVGMSDFSDRLVIELSDGERQKVMIAKALAQDTPLIILDEPTAFLDLPSRIETMQLLRRLARKKNKAILLSTHDLDLALQLADKVWLMAKNRDLEIGIPEDLVLSNGFRSFFEREGVLFDNLSGTFVVDREERKSVRLIGKGVEYQWVAKALARQGIATHGDKGGNMEIEVCVEEGAQYILSHSTGVKYKLRTIEDLLKQIKEIENGESVD